MVALQKKIWPVEFSKNKYISNGELSSWVNRRAMSNLKPRYFNWLPCTPPTPHSTGFMSPSETNQLQGLVNHKLSTSQGGVACSSRMGISNSSPPRGRGGGGFQFALLGWVGGVQLRFEIPPQSKEIFLKKEEGEKGCWWKWCLFK